MRVSAMIENVPYLNLVLTLGNNASACVREHRYLWSKNGGLPVTVCFRIVEPR